MHQARQHRLARTAARWLTVACALGLVAAAVPVAASAALSSPAVTSVHEPDARWSFTGAWITSGGSAFSGGSQALAVTPGASASVAFTGTSLELLATTGPKFGIANVSVDGGAPVAVDLYSPGNSFQRTVYSTGPLADTLHVVRISSTGTANPLASDKYVGVDAARITGALVSSPHEQSDTRIAKRGAWTTSPGAYYSGGSHMVSSAPGAETAVAFSGTGLQLVCTTGPKFGVASVSIDGGAPTDVDLYTADTRFRQVVFGTGALTEGRHTVRIAWTGRKNPAASDTFVGLDAALVDGTLSQAYLRFEDTDPRLGWAGSLHAEEAPTLSGGRYVTMGAGWGGVAVAFTGAGVQWVGTTGPMFGIAAVSVDGGPTAYVDLYSPDVRHQQTVWDSGALAYGTHTVAVTLIGRANAASSGAFVSVDAFDVAGDLVQASPPAQVSLATFNYPWNRYIVIDKSDLRLYYVIDGVLAASYPVATGRPSMPTPNGIWRIDAKYYTNPTSVFGPRKMRLFRQSGGTYVYSAYGIHGTDTDSSIGTYASHGCIRMHNYDVVPFFDTVPLGTMVVTRD